MNKICVYGHFGNNKNFLNGQTVKTKNVYNALQKHYNMEEINKVDTYNWKKNPFKVLKKCIKSFKNSENIIILPAQNGVKVFIPLFFLLKKIYKRKVFYVVIGGWLPEILNKRKGLLKKSQKLDKIFVETNSMKEKLNELNVNNVLVMPNFKNIEIVKKEELKKNIEKPIKICTFSRVMKEKGIEDAIEVVKNINQKIKESCILHIYGQIDENYKENFNKIIEGLPEYIEYKGIVEYEKSVQTIKNYDLLIFPTYYEGEGFAGTLIDAMSSGVPSIVTNWKYNNEIIKDKYNGYVYEVHNIQLKIILEKLIKDTNLIIKMKENCINEAQKYKEEEVIQILLNEIQRGVTK